MPCWEAELDPLTEKAAGGSVRRLRAALGGADARCPVNRRHRADHARGEVAGVITTFSLVPAGTHRCRVIFDEPLEAIREGESIEDVVWDPGYSLCRPG